MRTEDHSFFSDGLTLRGSFYLPDTRSNDKQPIVIACSGFTGLRHIHPERFGRTLAAHGVPAFGFDYRGFNGSEGTPCRVLLEEQVRDIMHAIGFVMSDARIDETRILLLGWGMGAGLVLDAARCTNVPIGVMAVNGFYNGPRFQEAHRGADGLRAFRDRVNRERSARSRHGDAAQTDPFDIYPLDPQSREYVDNVLRKTPGYEAETYSFELADSLLGWNVEAHAPSMTIPLLVAHGDHNMLHPVREAQQLYDAYGGAKSLYWIEGAGHTEFMHDDDPRYIALGRTLCDWTDDLLAGVAS